MNTILKRINSEKKEILKLRQSLRSKRRLGAPVSEKEFNHYTSSLQTHGTAVREIWRDFDSLLLEVKGLNRELTNARNEFMAIQRMLAIEGLS